MTKHDVIPHPGTIEKHVDFRPGHKGRPIYVRPLSLEEAHYLTPGCEALVVTRYYGRNRLTGVVRVKINGRPRTWKTRPHDLDVPIKYGLYEYTTISWRNGKLTDDGVYFVRTVDPS